MSVNQKFEKRWVARHHFISVHSLDTTRLSVGLVISSSPWLVERNLIQLLVTRVSSCIAPSNLKILFPPIHCQCDALPRARTLAARLDETWLTVLAGSGWLVSSSTTFSSLHLCNLMDSIPRLDMVMPLDALQPLLTIPSISMIEDSQEDKPVQGQSLVILNS